MGRRKMIYRGTSIQETAYVRGIVTYGGRAKWLFAKCGKQKSHKAKITPVAHAFSTNKQINTNKYKKPTLNKNGKEEN